MIILGLCLISAIILLPIVYNIGVANGISRVEFLLKAKNEVIELIIDKITKEGKS